MKKFLSLLSTIALLALLSSCWSSIQPNASALCDSVLYDYDPNENIFYINAELMNPASKGASETGMNTSADLILKGKGKSPESAYEDISSALERRLLFSHNKARFISERLASDKFALESLFDFILRGATSDERALLFVVKNEDIENFYKSETGLQKLLGDYIDGLSKVQPEESSKGIFKNTLDFIKESGEVGREPVLGVLSVTKTDLKGSGNRGGGEPAEKSKEKFLLKAEGGAVFKNGVFTGYLNDKESVYYNILSNRSAFSTAEITTGGISATVGLYRPKTVIKAEIVNGNLEVNITVNARLRIV
ncbi:MAG: Ger(x)C family spore germination C-terminal domain-containing protein, partial [Firmicutes bacterium]|nr:Ger(x)C family spore germination C-terminal domain-containing protein [Bacillota bacterium]